MTRKLMAALVAVVALLALAGCGGSENDGETQTSSTGQEFNEADVAFATHMMQHHAQALQMVDMTQGRELDPEAEQLAEQIRMAQTPEIEQMTEWLQSWGKPIPETSRDHANAHGDGSMDMDMSDMPGMMSAEQMAELEAAEGVEFQRMWLEMMIEHHQGAIEMAQAEQEEGAFGPAIQLAEEIEASQQAEVETMQELLAS